MRAAASCSDPRRVRSGARTLVEIGDPHRFDNPGRLAAYAGLAPVDWQSGRHSTTRRARGGNHRLKNAMFQAAFVATQHDPDARACYLRKRAEGKRHNAAVICVARRRCNIILAMVKTRTPLPTPTTRKTPKSAPRRLDNKTGTPPDAQAEVTPPPRTYRRQTPERPTRVQVPEWKALRALNGLPDWTGPTLDQVRDQARRAGWAAAVARRARNRLADVHRLPPGTPRPWPVRSGSAAHRCLVPNAATWCLGRRVRSEHYQTF